jgi:hypothetical protein
MPNDNPSPLATVLATYLRTLAGANKSQATTRAHRTDINTYLPNTPSPSSHAIIETIALCAASKPSTSRQTCSGASSAAVCGSSMAASKMCSRLPIRAAPADAELSALMPFQRILCVHE